MCIINDAIRGKVKAQNKETAVVDFISVGGSFEGNSSNS